MYSVTTNWYHSIYIKVDEEKRKNYTDRLLNFNEYTDVTQRQPTTTRPYDQVVQL